MSEYYEDKTLNCRDCKQPFTFTGGEQRFFVERGFTEPTRCKPCRNARKAQKEQQGGPASFAPQNGPSYSTTEVVTQPRRPVVYDAPPAGGPRKKQGGGGKRRRNEFESDWDE